jgi:hypothetical protein
MTPGPYALEGRFDAPLAAWGELAALVAHGTFAAIPGLRVAFLECGFTWLEPLLGRMGDVAELVREHVRISGGGDGDGDEALIERPGSILPDVLVYSGRGPRFETVSEPVRRRIMRENAKAVVRL